jgi:phosphatidylglycerophosphate synthase
VAAGLQVILVARAGRASLRVGGLGLLERWRAALAELGVTDVREVDPGAVGAALADLADVDVLVADGGTVLEPLALEALIEAPAARGESLVIADAGGRTAPALRLLPGAPRPPGDPLADRGPARAIPSPGWFWGDVADAAAAEAATWGMLRRLQHRPGGLVAKYLNRPISIRITRHLVWTPVTPNAMTVFAAVVGAIGVAVVAMGGWAYAVLGTGLLQVNSILDGVDGELARLRHQKSERGAWLDSICDEFLNAGLLLALGWNVAGQTGALAYLWAGGYAGAVSLLYALAHWHCKMRHGMGFYWWFDLGKPRRDVQRSTSVMSYVKKILWRETTLLVYFAAALGGFLGPALIASALAATSTLTLFVIHIGVKRAPW